MTVEELSKIQAEMPTAELIEKTKAWNTRLCRSGGREWTLRVPVSENDPDMLIGEVCKRLESLEAENAAIRDAVKEMQRMLLPLERLEIGLPETFKAVIIGTDLENLDAYRQTLEKALAKINESK